MFFQEIQLKGFNLRILVFLSVEQNFWCVCIYIILSPKGAFLSLRIPIIVLILTFEL